MLESEAVVAGGFTDYIHRSAFAFGYLTYVFDSLFLNQQTHALLTFVGYDFFGRQSLVADRQFAHVDKSAALFYQLGQAVYMSGRTVVVDGNHRVGVFFAKRTYYVVSTFLHLCIGTLYGIQLDAAAVASRIYG